MDNKLSELSKPVAQAYYDEHDSSTMLIDWLVDSVPKAPASLYSQEYVSAMLAELEFEKQNNSGVAGMVEDYETKLEAKDKRIIGLERHVKDIEATLIVATDEVADLMKERDEARAKLATPVRLPQLCGDGDNDTEYTEGLNDGITQSAIYLRRQGFKVEGDEQ